MYNSVFLQCRILRAIENPMLQHAVDFGQAGIDERLRKEEERIGKAEAKASGREYAAPYDIFIYFMFDY